MKFCTKQIESVINLNSPMLFTSYVTCSVTNFWNKFLQRKEKITPISGEVSAALVFSMTTAERGGETTEKRRLLEDGESRCHVVRL